MSFFFEQSPSIDTKMTWLRTTTGSLIEKCKGLVAKIHYAKLLKTRPLGIMLFTGIASICLTSLTIKFTDWPLFSDPKMGFETRGTVLSGRMLTYRNLGKELSIYPDSSKRFFRQYEQFNRDKRNIEHVYDFNNSTIFVNTCNNYQKNHLEADQFVQMIFESSSEDILFQRDTLTELCKFQQNIWQHLKPFVNKIEEPGYIWSLPNYMACLTESTSCLNINETKLEKVKATIEYCVQHRTLIISCYNKFGRYKWTKNNTAEECNSIPVECTSKLYYDLFNVLLSRNTFSNTTDSVFTMLVLPVRNLHNLDLLGMKNEDIKENLITLYKKVNKDVNENDELLSNVKYVGHFFGIKLDIFGRLFVEDSVDVLIGLPLISLVIWFYAGSIFYTVSVVLTLVFSAGLTYFVYRLVFRIQFFPFINLLAVAILVGVGGDDTFVLRHIFDLYKKHGFSSISDNDIGEALSNAALSMFVTSVTTAAALYSLLISDVMIIKCFGVFSGTMILMNYLLVVSWLPACLIVNDKYIEPLYRSLCCKKFLIKSFKICSMFSMATDYLLVSRLMPWMVTKLKYFWLSLFGALFVAASYIVFYHPGLSLPETNLLQVFRTDSPFEWYSNNAEKYFEFSSAKLNTPIDIAVVWGLQPVDNSDPLNPMDTGTIILDETFRITLSTLQAIMYSCESLDSGNVTALITHNLCFPSQFLQWSEKQTCNATGMTSSSVCCNFLNGNFKESDLSYCLAEATSRMDLLDYGHPIFDSATYFNEGQFKVVGLVIYFDSPFNKTQPFKALDSFYKLLDEQFQKTMRDSTSDDYMQNAWFVTGNYDTIGWYDLETSLLKKTPLSLIISVAVTLIVVVLSTKAILLSFLSMLTILAVIIVTVACLVLLKWQLNIVESTIFVMAVGLGMDFSIHYAVGYKLAPSGTRDEKVFATLAYISVPVALCCLTTFLAGCAMLRVTTLAYYETGLFMIIVSTISWLYANFFFLPLLSCCGPQDVGFTSWTLNDIFVKTKELIFAYFKKNSQTVTMNETRIRTATSSLSDTEICSL